MDQCVWTKYGLLYTYRYEGTAIDHLGMIDIGSQKQTILLSDAIGGSTFIISVDPYAPRIIIVIDEDINENIGVYDLKTKKVEQTLCTTRGCPYLTAVEPSPYVGLLTCDSSFRFFYWKTRSLEDVSSNSVSSLEWRPDLGEFILMGNTGNHQWFESVGP